jgi:peptidyl-prolyl cis-trans isomerase D
MIRFLQTPGRAKKVVLGAMLLFICVALVLSLGVGGMTPDRISQRGVVAEVGDEKITTEEIQGQVRRMMPQQGNYGQEMMAFFVPRALENMIFQKVSVLEAERLGLRVSDEELKDELRNGFLKEQIFPNGNFIGQDAYEQFVSQNLQMSAAQFEKVLKQDLLIRKLHALIQDTAAVTPAEVQREGQRQFTKVKFDYAVLTPNDLMKEINPSESELRAYYEAHKANYNDSIPEKRKIRYAVADLNKLQSQIKVSPEEITRYYERNKEQYRQPEQVKVHHILVAVPRPEPGKTVDEAVVEQARKKAESLLKQVKSGANFEQLAKKNSDDKTTAVEGGALPWFQRGAMEPDFEKVAFSLPKGQTSDVVKSSFGFHIIRVDDRREAGFAPLAQVRDAIESSLRQEKAQAQAETLERNLQSDVGKLGLAEAAQKHGLELVTSDFVTRGDSLPGIGAAPEFMEAVFATPEKARPSVTRTAQAIVAFEVSEVRPPQTPNYEQVKQDVAQRFRQERARTLLLARTQQLSDRARAEHNLKRAAKELGATLKASELVGVNSQVPDLGSMSGPAGEAFKLKVGEISGPIYDGRDGAVLSVTERKEPSAAELQQGAERVSEQLLQKKRNEMLVVYFGGAKERLQKDGKIKINENELKSLTRSSAGS